MQYIGVELPPGELFTEDLMSDGLVELRQEGARMDLPPAQVRAKAARTRHSGDISQLIVALLGINSGNGSKQNKNLGTVGIDNKDQNNKEKIEIEKAASLIHEALGLRHYSRSDFIITPSGVYILETNTLPGLTAESLLPKSLVAIGAKFPQFLDHIITLALSSK